MLMHFRARIVFFSILSVAVSGCGVYKSKVTAPGPEVAALSAEQIGYSEMRLRLFEPSCVRCHRVGSAGDGVLVDSYGNVTMNLQRIYQAVVVEKSMPPEGPLPAPRLQELTDWIQRGAPLAASGGTSTGRTASPTPVPTATPIFVRGTLAYRDLQEKVIGPQCVRCHGETRARGNVRLDSYEAVRTHLDEIRETVFQKRSMPPKGMPNDQRDYLREWIDLGAPESPTAISNPSPAPTAAPTATPAFVRGALVYRDLQEKVIGPQCVRCHGETRPRHNVRLDSYEAVRTHLDGIRKTAIEKRSMPPKGMPEEQRDYLREWLELGAPEARQEIPALLRFANGVQQTLWSWIGVSDAQAARPKASSKAAPASGASPSPTVSPSPAAKGTVFEEKDGVFDFYAIGKPSLLKIHGTSTVLTGQLEQSNGQLFGHFTLPMENVKTGGMKLRDEHLQAKVFETAKYPTSELTLEPIPAKSGEELPFKGKLKFHGVEKEIAGTVRLQLAANQVGYQGSFKIKQSDFGVTPPEYMGMSMQDEVTVEVKGQAEK